MKCLRCHNEDPNLFFYDQGIYYCRACIQFGKLEAGARDPIPKLKHRIWKGEPVLKFELTPMQKKASMQALNALKRGRDVFVYAAAGAGKTEMSLASICYYLSLGKKVGFAISRRQVVLQIAKRLHENFPELEITPVCEGYTRYTDGDIIVCTTHQLYRYPDTFDLLIIDEADAFPYVNNPILQQLSKNACRGRKMLLSATPDSESMKAIQEGKMELVQLFKRPHGKPLCVPKIRILPDWLSLICILNQCRHFHQKRKQALIFVPRKSDCMLMKHLIGIFFKTDAVHSGTLRKDAVMERLYNKEIEFLICTTLLERGITVPSVQVLVYQADHIVFTSASLIQIFGRVGRTFDDPEGTGICYAKSISNELKECCRQLEWMNRNASGA